MNNKDWTVWRRAREEEIKTARKKKDFFVKKLNLIREQLTNCNGMPYEYKKPFLEQRDAILLLIGEQNGIIERTRRAIWEENQREKQ